MSRWLQLLVEDMSSLMRAVALHNAPLLHQHSCRRMDSGAVAVREQVPPPGFYKSILVRPVSPSAPPLFSAQKQPMGPGWALLLKEHHAGSSHPTADPLMPTCEVTQLGRSHVASAGGSQLSHACGGCVSCAP